MKKHQENNFKYTAYTLHRLTSMLYVFYYKTLAARWVYLRIQCTYFFRILIICKGANSFLNARPSIPLSATWSLWIQGPTAGGGGGSFFFFFFPVTSNCFSIVAMNAISIHTILEGKKSRMKLFAGTVSNLTLINLQ